MHGHSHGGINDKPDWLTNLGAIGETIEGAANFFFGATVYDTLYEICNGHEIENPYGGPLYLGLILGIISLGTAYTHRKLDVYHQNVRLHVEEEHICNHDHHEHSPEEVKDSSQLNIDIPSPQALLDEPLLIDSEEDKPVLKEKKEIPLPKLTFWQKVSLVSDASSHVLGRAGLLTGMVDGITTTFTKSSLSPTTRAYVQLGSLFFGGVTSASGIRTCLNTLLEQNHEKDRLESKKGLRK